MKNYDHLTRQLDIIPLNTLGYPVTIIGAGAIGSFTALALAKMGMHSIAAWDFDDVSVYNMNNQFYRFKDIGQKKVTALQSLIKDFTETDIEAIPRRFTSEDTAFGIVIVAVDSMAARKEIFENLSAKKAAVSFIIDPRMGAEQYMQYAFRMSDAKAAKNYQGTLYDSSEVEAVRCTEKSTVYTATLAAGFVAKTVKNILLGEAIASNVSWNIKASENNPAKMAMVSYATAIN